MLMLFDVKTLLP